MKVQGLRLVDNSDTVKNAKDATIRRILETIGQLAEGYAATKAPVDTGRLRGSITHAVDGHAVHIGTNVEYAAYVEMGTRHQRPQPYLKPAITDHVAEYKSIAEAELKKDIT